MYKKIIEFWINEKENEELQRPPPDFMNGVERYLEDLGRAENGIPGKLREGEEKRIKWMLERIRSIRREKICKGVVSGTLVEGTLFEDEMLLFKPPKRNDVEGVAKKILVRMLRDVPSFVGADLRTYGPYKAEDVVLLPAQNAEALIKRGIAMTVQRKV